LLFQTPLELTAKARGPKGWQLFLGTSIFVFYGFSRVGAGNKNRTEQKLHERQGRYALAPILQQEADREYMMRVKKLMEQEANIMSNVPGWKVGQSQYYGQRWTPAHVADSDRSNQKK
jgi:NADH dehydrogenase (ubiquinone) 1 alpha subcomplex subunit 13